MMIGTKLLTNTRNIILFGPWYRIHNLMDYVDKIYENKIVLDNGD